MKHEILKFFTGAKIRSAVLMQIFFIDINLCKFNGPDINHYIQD